jgi:hypothetical protein
MMVSQNQKTYELRFIVNQDHRPPVQLDNVRHLY